MKKIISILLIFALIAAFALVSCGDKGENGDGTSAGDVSGSGNADPNGNKETEAETDPPPLVDLDLQGLVDFGSIVGTEGVIEGESAIHIFDGDVTTKWCARQSTLEIEWKMTEAVTVNYYYLTTANDAPERNPEDWVFYGSVDGEEWVELSNIEGAGLPGEFFADSDIYKIENPQSFEYYKLSVTAIVNPEVKVAQFSEFNFFSTAK